MKTCKATDDSVALLSNTLPMSETKKIILDTSDEAAKPYTMEGWLSSDGRFFKDESTARYAGSTHSTCSCGKLMKRGYTKCEWCSDDLAYQRYLGYFYKEYNGEPVVTRDGDTYFFSEDELTDYMVDNELESIDLLFCEKNHFHPVNEDYWADYMPDDSDGELPQALQEALDNLNKVIETLPPVSYSPAKIRTSYTLENDTNTNPE